MPYTAVLVVVKGKCYPYTRKPRIGQDTGLVAVSSKKILSMTA